MAYKLEFPIATMADVVAHKAAYETDPEYVKVLKATTSFLRKLDAERKAAPAELRRDRAAVASVEMAMCAAVMAAPLIVGAHHIAHHLHHIMRLLEIAL
jgi:hypothetical protein